MLLLLAIAMLSGCVAGSDLNMRGVVGKHSSHLAAVRGLPDEKASDGNGGEVWIYVVKREWTTAGRATTTVDASAYSSGSFQAHQYYPRNIHGTYQGQTQVQGRADTYYTPPKTSGYIGHRSFFINKDGIVYRYAWQGL